MEFCHIVPTNYIPIVDGHKRHLVLAHLVEKNHKYVDNYLNIKHQDTTFIMDNSAFEMFKLNKPMFDPDKLIDLGNKIKADIIVLPDYPREDYQKTIDQCEKYIDTFKSAGFGVMFVPQSRLGDLQGYIECVKYGLNNKKIDIVGLSILGCPTALGLQENTYGVSNSRQYKLQRYKSRFQILNELNNNGLLTENAINRFHCLGMADGPKEIKLLCQFSKYIQSWDTSSAAWHGINGVLFDQSETGLINGKIESEVDFDVNFDDNNISNIRTNIKYIDNLVSQYGGTIWNR